MFLNRLLFYKILKNNFQKLFLKIDFFKVFLKTVTTLVYIKSLIKSNSLHF